MPKIFISYGRDESHGQNLATEAQQQLQSAGFEVFRDVIGLKPGDIWYSKLEFELDSSDLVILIVSEKIRTSEWVHNEISMAKEIGLPIIPVIAERVRMPLWLQHLQTLDFSEREEWQQLLSAIHVHLPNDELSAPSISEYVKHGFIVENEVLQTSGSIDGSRGETNRASWASQTGSDKYGQYADLEVNNVIQRFRLINPGTFQMGSPESEKERNDNETLHQVTLSKAFWLADTACTQALWVAVMYCNPSRFTEDKNNPVENVSWNDIQEFLQALGEMKSGVIFQLPTEAQWEYACRAGTATPFSFGENMAAEQVNYDGRHPYKKGFFQKQDLYRDKTLAVQSLPENQWGLYEMHGNVWEWCQDAYKQDLDAQARTDPSVQAGDYRVLRGGSWFNNGWFCRSANRNSGRPVERYNNYGFRLALVN